MIRAINARIWIGSASDMPPPGSLLTDLEAGPLECQAIHLTCTTDVDNDGTARWIAAWDALGNALTEFTIALGPRLIQRLLNTYDAPTRAVIASQRRRRHR